MPTLREARQQGEELLKQAGVPDAHTDAFLLLAYAANVDRSYYYMHQKQNLDAADAETFFYLVDRRCEREPLQYLTGEAPFYGEDFYVTPDVLIPRQDTERLVELVVASLKPGMQVLDLCTGSGCILLTLARLCPILAVGADLSVAALAVAERNRRRMGLRASWIESDLFARIGGTFDCIVSNPPYIRSAELATLEPEVRSYEPSLALDGGVDGLEVIRRIAKDAGKHLRQEGLLWMEIGWDQGAAVQEILQQQGYQDIQLYQDLEQRDRVVRGTYSACTRI